MSNKTVAERLWAKTQPQGDCLVWIGARSRGYGHISVQTKMRLVHRVAYELAYGAIPDGLDVLHTCDNPSCVNPDHLRVGTHTDNMRDMQNKGRNRQPRGEQSSRSKLTDAQVRAIRERYAAGGVSLREVARDYGVHLSLISLIVRREIWRHV